MDWVRFFWPALMIALIWHGGAWAQEGDIRLRVAKKMADKGQIQQALQEIRLHLAEHPESVPAYVLSGHLLLRTGKKEEAAESFRKALAQDPADLEAQDGLSAALEKEKTSPSAKPGSQPAAKTAKADKVKKTESHASLSSSSPPSSTSVTAPSTPSTQYQDKDFLAAIADYRGGKKAQAQQKLRKVLGKYPGHAGAYYLGGVMRYEAGELKKAAYNFKRGFAYPDKGYNGHFYLGRIYQKEGRKKEAVEEFNAYMAATPSQEGKERAKKILEELATSEMSPPKTAALAHPKGDPGIPPATDPPGSHASAPDSAKADPPTFTPGAAAVASEKSLARLPMEDGFLYLIPDSLSAAGRKMAQAHAYYRRDRLEAAVQNLKDVVRDFPGTENADVARLNLAAIYLKMQLWSEAQNQLEAFAASSPDRIRRYLHFAHYLLGRSHLGAGEAAGEGGKAKVEKAEHYFQKAQPDSLLGPSAAERDWQLALCGRLLPDLTKRSAYYAQALKSQSQGYRRVFLHMQTGLHEAKFGQVSKAEGRFQAALKICETPGLPPATSPLCVEAAVRLADMAFKQENWTKALSGYKAFVQAYPQAPDLPWAQYQVGNTHKGMGQYDQALIEYQRVIDNFPDSYWAAQAKWQREDAIWQKEYAEVLD